MKASELREKTVEELKERLDELYKERFELRMRHLAGGQGQTHLMGEARRNIARARTVIAEKLAAKPAGKPAAEPGGEPAADGGGNDGSRDGAEP